ncbi:MAG TPA: hypothetical protein VGL91_11785 [Acidobacteriota bacterium]|jgi:hypothetical protein
MVIAKGCFESGEKLGWSLQFRFNRLPKIIHPKQGEAKQQDISRRHGAQPPLRGKAERAREQ